VTTANGGFTRVQLARLYISTLLGQESSGASHGCAVLRCAVLRVGTSALYTKKADTSTAATSTQVSEFVRLIKEQYGLQHVYAWHASMGYWSGVSPAAAIADAATAAAAADLHGGAIQSSELVPCATNGPLLTQVSV
jgi:hypothetical protein